MDGDLSSIVRMTSWIEKFLFGGQLNRVQVFAEKSIFKTCYFVFLILILHVAPNPLHIATLQSALSSCFMFFARRKC